MIAFGNFCIKLGVIVDDIHISAFFESISDYGKLVREVLVAVIVPLHSGRVRLGTLHVGVWHFGFSNVAVRKRGRETFL